MKIQKIQQIKCFPKVTATTHITEIPEAKAEIMVTATKAEAEAMETEVILTEAMAAEAEIVVTEYLKAVMTAVTAMWYFKVRKMMNISICQSSSVTKNMKKKCSKSEENCQKV